MWRGKVGTTRQVRRGRVFRAGESERHGERKRKGRVSGWVDGLVGGGDGDL